MAATEVEFVVVVPDVPERGRGVDHRVAGMRLRMTLARQFLALQLVIVLVVVLGVAADSLAQSAATFERIEGRRVLAVAERVAATSLVRLGRDDRATREALAAMADGAQSVSGASFVVITSPDRTILTAPDPRQIGGRLPLGGSSVLQGRSWTGVVGGGRHDSGGGPCPRDPVQRSALTVQMPKAYADTRSVPQRRAPAATRSISWLSGDVPGAAALWRRRSPRAALRLGGS